MIILSSCLLVFSLLPSTASKNPKRGLAIAEGGDILQIDVQQSGLSKSAISWQYNWASSPPVIPGVESIPMQWGVDGIESFASKVISQGAKTVLAFNEPDFESQSNINATYAASLWKQYINPLASSGIRLGAPAVTNAPGGRPWLAEFLSACYGCTIDFIPFHWYGTGVGNFYDYLWQMHSQFPDKPLWVTEFASTSTSDEEVLDFLNATTRYMDTLDWVQGYAWFAFFVRRLPSNCVL
ncbi:glycoside hydrolase family 128 protein [Hebeloma cylindrosporum]|uniref:Glycoside hydrolase family 128 protein n=1 Tax=Hebeloma cylindrosporum TaxID=76867 RepID=A0A0C3CI75_HEBCY|nr:glycoside hydrolase family 128 protein [Hebeloma cylindrosporum h7]